MGILCSTIFWGREKMKKIINKILSLLLCCVLIEQGKKTEEGLIYKIEDNKAIITGYEYKIDYKKDPLGLF